MDDEDNDYELERQKTIAENRLLLDSLGLDPNGASKLPHTKLAKPKPKPKPASAPSKKRKAPVASSLTDEGPRRRSGRLAGIEATPEAIAKREEDEEREREVLRVVSRKERGQLMQLKDMVEETSPSPASELETFLRDLGSKPNPRTYISADKPSAECYADKEKLPKEVARLKEQFKGMALRANAKVTPERVFSMLVHPEPTKNVVLAGDKYGMLGIWDALGRNDEISEDVDDTTGPGVKEEEEEEGRVWHVQAHARNSITCMKVDPTNGSGLFSSSYDCSLRHIDFQSLISRELFAFGDEDMLITHFDIAPNGVEAWLTDKNGGISHVDLREDRRGVNRRRWVVQEEGRAAKLGGISINPLMPNLIVTAGNDQHVRVWDIRHLLSLSPNKADHLEPPPAPTYIIPVKSEEENGDVKTEETADRTPAPERIPTWPTSSIPYERVEAYMASSKGKGLLRGAYQHGKSCSAAYWDPFGRKILTTSYDDKLRVWNLNPQSLLLDQPLAPTHFQPSLKLPHNCQTGRWLTILRAQWSLNTDYIPHFTVGNMKRSLDVVACTGEKIVSLWAEGVTAVPAVTASHPSRVDCVVGGNTSGRVQLWMAGSE